MYNLIETKNGKETVVMTDDYKNVMRRMKELKTSQRKVQVKYKMVETTDNVKFMKKPSKRAYFS
jgi:hypothetical protein